MKCFPTPLLAEDSNPPEVVFVSLLWCPCQPSNRQKREATYPECLKTSEHEENKIQLREINDELNEQLSRPPCLMLRRLFKIRENNWIIRQKNSQIELRSGYETVERCSTAERNSKPKYLSLDRYIIFGHKLALTISFLKEIMPLEQRVKKIKGKLEMASISLIVW